MISKILTFGDSYMYGTELPQEDPDLKEHINKIVEGLPRDPISGAIPIDILKSVHFDKLWDLEMKTNDYETRCHNYCISGIVARHFNIPEYKNFSWAGYSNDAILVELLSHMHEITNDTLVIVGLTFPFRTTRLNESTNYNKIKSFNNHHNLNKNRDHERYIELSMEYDDDILVKYIHTMNHISTIKSILANVPHVIIDPINIYRESKELNGKLLDDWFLEDTIKSSILRIGDDILYPGVVDHLQDFFNNNTFGYTFNHSLLYAKDNNVYGRALLGHPSRYAHEHFAAEFLIPYIKRDILKLCGT